MGLVRHTETSILVDISNISLGETVIKRKAELVHMEYSTITKQVILELRIQQYAKDTDGSSNEIYGDRIDGVIPGCHWYTKKIRATMEDLVDVDNGGVVLGPASLIDDPANSETGGILFEKNYMYEFEYYKMIAAGVPVIIDDMIIGKILEADTQGKLD